jgi:hypothetical protein
MKTNNYLFTNSKQLDYFLQHYNPDGGIYSNVGIYSFEDTIFYDGGFDSTLTMLIMLYDELHIDVLNDDVKLSKYPLMYLLIIKIKPAYLNDQQFARYFCDLLKNSHLYNLHIFVISNKTPIYRALKMINFFVYDYKTPVDSILNIFTFDDVINFKKNFHKMESNDYLVIANNQYHFFPHNRHNHINYHNLIIKI